MYLRKISKRSNDCDSSDDFVNPQKKSAKKAKKMAPRSDHSDNDDSTAEDMALSVTKNKETNRASKKVPRFHRNPDLTHIG